MTSKLKIGVKCFLLQLVKHLALSNSAWFWVKEHGNGSIPKPLKGQTHMLTFSDYCGWHEGTASFTDNLQASELLYWCLSSILPWAATALAIITNRCVTEKTATECWQELAPRSINRWKNKKKSYLYLHLVVKGFQIPAFTKIKSKSKLNDWEVISLPRRQYTIRPRCLLVDILSIFPLQVKVSSNLINFLYKFQFFIENTKICSV